MPCCTVWASLPWFPGPGIRKVIPRRKRLSKKTLPEAVQRLRESHPERPLELWFQDEARFGQQGTLTRVWAFRGQRAVAPRQIGYEWSYLYGSVDPLSGRTHGLALPYVNLEMMRLYLEDFSRTVGEDRLAVLICDQAGWHTSGRLVLPSNVCLLPLPPKSPELNPAELIWREMRQKHLGNRVFPDVDAVVEQVCSAWNAVTADESQLQRLCRFQWIAEAFN